MSAAGGRIRRFIARHLFFYLTLLVLVATVAGAVLAREAIVHTWGALPAWTAPAVLGLSLVNYALRFARWQLLLGRLHCPAPTRGSARIWFASLAMVVTPGRVGELAKLGLLRTHYGIPVRRSAAALLIDRTTDALALLALGATGMSVAAGPTGLLSVLLPGALAVLFVATSPRPRRALRHGLERWRLTRRYSAALEELLRSNALLLRPSALLPAMGLAVLAWLAECIGLYCITVGLTIPVRWVTATWIYALSTLAGNLTFVPGGLIGTELSLVALLRQHHASHDAAVAAALLVRAATLWFAVAIGVATTFWNRRTLRFAQLDELTSAGD